MASSSQDPEKVVPPEDHDRLIERTIVVDGDRMRHVRVGDAWDDAADGFVPETMTSVSDGTIARSLHRCGINGDERLVGFIHSHPFHPDRSCLYLGSILAHYRPFGPGLGSFTTARWELVNPVAPLNGSSCILIREGKDTDLRYTELYVDPGKDYALVRYRRHFHGRIEKS